MTKKKGKNNQNKESIITKSLNIGIIILIIVLAFLIFNKNDGINKISETRNLMGTYMSITVYHNNTQEANIAIEKAFQEARMLEKSLSNYINTSDVSILNSNKTLYNPSIELIENLMISEFLYQQSYGAFDITVQPVLDLYKKTFNELNRSPTDDEIEIELLKIDGSNVIVNGSYVSIGANQSITLGGVAKGYIVDRVLEMLTEHNIKSALVNAGGDLKAIGLKHNNEYWNIALSNPDNKNEHITKIHIRNKSVVTSGNYERYFDENKKFHHIIDPKTGRSANNVISVTIISDFASVADALSTTVFVLGEKEGLDFIEIFEDTEGLIITNNRTILKSSGWDNATHTK